MLAICLTADDGLREPSKRRRVIELPEPRRLTWSNLAWSNLA